MMENIEKKLNTNNPALVSQVFSQIVQIASSSANVQQEFQFLKAKCLGPNSLLCDVASMSILHLVESKVLETDQVLTEFVTSISTSSNATSLTKMIVSLLQLKFGTVLPASEQSLLKFYKLTQHPLIKILQEELHYDLQSCIYNEIVRTCSSVKLSQALRLQTVFEPLYLYCLASPKAKLELGFLKHKLWSFLLKFDETNKTKCIFLPCCWLQMQFKNADLASDLLNEVLQNQLQSAECYKSLDYLILVQMMVINNLVLNYSDIRVSVGIVLEILQGGKSTFNHHNAALLILSKTVLIASPRHLEQLLELCLHLSSDNRCKPYSFLTLKTALLYWLGNPSFLTQNASVTAHKILALNDHVFRNRPQIMANRVTIDKYNSLLFCNPELLFYIELAIKVECINTNEVQVMVNHLEKAPMTFLNQIFTFMCGLMLDPTLESGLKIRLLRLLVKCGCDFNQNYLPVLLSVLLHLLSNSEDSNLHLELLKALPFTVRVKENVSKVVATLLAISKRSAVLNNLAMRLLYDTWQIDHSCYSTLETFFALPPTITKDEVFERNITRAYVFNKLSEQRPELYGRDLVAHLSKILNECTSSYNAIAASLAIEGIRHLCKAEIIDVVTTWATLSPKFKSDNRTPVIKSLCKLIGDIPNLEYTESYDKLYDEVTQHLWNYIVNSESKEVISEALDALSLFSLEWICAHIPDQYLDEGSSNQGEKRLLPGKTWIKFLESNKSPEAVCIFLSKLVSKEVDNYLKYVYQLKSQREPENYGSLPSHSIVRALGEYLKRNFLKINKWDNPKQEQLFLHCLQVFSVKYSKPLPPLDWCFLQEVIHEPCFKGYCLDLASHQAILSGSARRLVENYILAITDNPKVEDTIHIYRNLLYLANSIQPIVIKPFLVNTLQLLLGDTTDTFQNVLMHLKIVLAEKDVQEVNKLVIEEVLTDLVALNDTSSKVFDALLSCLPSFSQNGQEKVASFTSETLNKQDFKKITKIRCHLARNAGANPLKWLHNLIKIAYKNGFPLDLYYNDFTSTLKKQQNHEESPHWLNDLFGEIQRKVADQCDAQEIEHYCEILTISVVHFSGLDLILPKYGHSNNKYVFTAALKFLLEESMWSVSVTQILEWLHYMNLSDSITETYRRIFGWTLCGLRHEDEFAKSSRWLRFLDSEVCIKNVL